MKSAKRLFAVTIALGIVSFLILVFYYLALTDIWHENGSPDIWHGQGPAAVEWKFISIAYWPMLLFHVLFFIASSKLLRRRDQRIKSNNSVTHTELTAFIEK